MKNKFNEKDFRENALLSILREGMNEPKNACYVSESIKSKCVDSAKWGYYECYAQIENLLANNHEFGLGLDAGAADIQRSFEARDAKIKEILLGLDSRFLNDYEPSAFDRKQIKKALLLLEDEEAIRE